MAINRNKSRQEYSDKDENRRRRSFNRGMGDNDLNRDEQRSGNTTGRTSHSSNRNSSFSGRSKERSRGSNNTDYNQGGYRSASGRRGYGGARRSGINPDRW